jgi:hypothetical protein
MQAAADDGVSSSNEDAAWELEDKEQLELARQASFRGAGSAGCSGGFGAPARLPAQEVVAAAQPVRAPDAAAEPPSTTATTLAWLIIAAPGDRWGGGCSAPTG